MTDSAFELLSTHQNVPSAVLHNTLLQLKGLPTFPLTPESLTQPLFKRREQILQYPTIRLHLGSQKSVFVTSSGVIAGVDISLLGWLAGLLGFEGMDGTFIGVGMLVAVTGIRWAVSIWENSKKRWWRDWSRVSEGLDRDLKVYLPFVSVAITEQSIIERRLSTTR